jgi:hypothetical protein
MIEYEELEARKHPYPYSKSVIERVRRPARPSLRYPTSCTLGLGRILESEGGSRPVHGNIWRLCLRALHLFFPRIG